MVRLSVENGEVKLMPTKIVAVGRNYVEHAREMGGGIPREPIIFLKPPSSIVGHDSEIILPPESREVHHEIELGVIVGRRGKNIPVEKAYEHVYGYTVFLDITARDIQREAKKLGLPWTVAKGFDTFSPLGPRIVLRDKIDPASLTLTLRVNGDTRQKGNTEQMIFSIPYLVSYISRLMTLEPGDIIATGTPEGVGEIRDGDIIDATIEGIGTLREYVKRY